MLKLLKTKDDSFTLYNVELDETYHSRHGAVVESRHVFIRNGLLPLLAPGKKIHILEIGFGTGLNALLTLLEFEKAGTSVHYTGIEPFPLSKELVSELGYATLLDLDSEQKNCYLHMHEGKANHMNEQQGTFEFILEKKEFLSCSFDQPFDLIYFDAFAPGKQAAMWNAETFRYCYELLHPHGILVTYCAKGEVKRTLKASGFKVETLPGPPGKREMVRAVKTGFI